jgi:hypothetical protein
LVAKESSPSKVAPFAERSPAESAEASCVVVAYAVSTTELIVVIAASFSAVAVPPTYQA